MYSAQLIDPKRAVLWLPLETSYVDGGVTYTPSVGRGTGAVSRAIVGDMGYLQADVDFSVDKPFTIIVVSDSDFLYAGTLAATYDGVTGLGVRFGSTGSGVLIAQIFASDGTISQTSAVGYLPKGRMPRQFAMSYDGSGTPAGITMYIDSVQVPSTPTGGAIAGNISSGRDLLIGARWQGALPSEIIFSIIYRVEAYGAELGVSELSLTRRRDLIQASVSVFNIFSPASFGAGLVDCYDANFVTFGAGAAIASMTGLVNGVHLAQANAALQPTQIPAGSPSGKAVARFTAHSLATEVMVLNQPVLVLFACKWTNVGGVQVLCDGRGSGDTLIIYYDGAVMKGHAGAGVSYNPQPVSGTWYVYEFLSNGANGAVSLSGAARTVGNTGASVPAGFTLGSHQSGVVPATIDVARVILMRRDFLDAAERANAVAWCQAGI